MKNSILKNKKTSKNVKNILSYHVDCGEKSRFKKNSFKIRNVKVKVK